jgi:hypothetical protein
LAIGGESDDPPLDVGSFRLIFGLIIDLFRSRAALEAVLVLKQQIIVLRRGKPIRMPFFGCRQGHSGLGLPPVSEGARQVAEEAKNGSAMTMATLGKAKILGLIIDRREVGDVGA